MTHKPMTEERLAIFRGERDAIRADEQKGVHQPGSHWHVVALADAVDEIDRLRAENERLTAARPRCHAHRDGECGWQHCPQNINGEPERSGRHCPLDVLYTDDET